MKCKICGEKLNLTNPPRAPVKITGLWRSVEYDLNDKKKPTGVKKVVTKCDNGHLQMVRYDWDEGEYVNKGSEK